MTKNRIDKRKREKTSFKAQLFCFLVSLSALTDRPMGNACENEHRTRTTNSARKKNTAVSGRIYLS